MPHQLWKLEEQNMVPEELRGIHGNSLQAPSRWAVDFTSFHRRMAIMSTDSGLIEVFASRSGEFTIKHDGVVHHSLGGASYVYEKELVKPLLRNLGLVPQSAHFPSGAFNDDELEVESFYVDSACETDALRVPPGHNSATTLFIHIGAQPNNSPHAGTMVTFALAFVLGQRLQHEYYRLRARALSLSPESAPSWIDDFRVVVKLDLVDTAADSGRTEVHDGTVYQYRRHRNTGTMNAYLQDYRDLIAELEQYVGREIKAELGNQEELMRMPAMRTAIRTILRDRVRIAQELAPEHETLAIRSACPHDGCGMADKLGVKNEYVLDQEVTTVKFRCPRHGPYALALEDPKQLCRLELNTSLRNLARALVYMADTEDSRVDGQATPTRIHMRVTGMDFAGFYQEKLLYRQLLHLKPVAEPPMRDIIGFPEIVYAPLIIDWSGAKLSKSLYVKSGAYEYLESQLKTYLQADGRRWKGPKGAFRYGAGLGEGPRQVVSFLQP
ncbi:hypothetical protein ACG7TL_008515 [Trametes sanguinea]